MTTLKSPVSMGDVQKTPNWEDDISPLIKAPYWVTKNPEVIGQRWISEMLYWGKWDLSNYDDVRKRALGIYRHLRSKSMPVTRNPDHYWPESALETFRMWANNDFPRDSNCQHTQTPVPVIPDPNDPPISFKVRKDIMSLSREELAIYQAKLDDILGARELGSKWQELGVLRELTIILKERDSMRETWLNICCRCILVSSLSRSHVPLASSLSAICGRIDRLPYPLLEWICERSCMCNIRVCWNSSNVP